MKKFIIFLCALMLLILPCVNVDAAEKKAKKNKTVEIEYETRDNFIITATLTYPKVKAKLYPVVVLLHSIGANGNSWGTLPDKFLEAGFVVLNVDLRGHGKSIYNVNLDKKYWQNMSLKAFAKYPSDISGLLEYVHQEHKNVSNVHYAIVGADIGANTAVLAAQNLKTKPFAMVLISPLTSFKGLYIPIAIADLPKTDLMFVYSQKDVRMVQEVKSIKRFAQAKTIDVQTSQGGSGMSLLKTNPKLAYEVVNWCVDEFNAYLDKSQGVTPKK